MLKEILKYNLLLASIIIISCNDMPVVSNGIPKPKGYVIYSIISPEYDEQGVYVGEYTPYKNPIDCIDARVMVINGTNSWSFELSEPGYYKIDSKNFMPIPLHTYKLVVKTKDGHSFSAFTTIPDSFDIKFPSLHDTLTAILRNNTLEIDTKILFTPSQGSALMIGWFPSRPYLNFQSSVTNPFEMPIKFSIPREDIADSCRGFALDFIAVACDSSLSQHALENGLGSFLSMESTSSYISFDDALGIFGSLREIKQSLFFTISKSKENIE